MKVTGHVPYQPERVTFADEATAHAYGATDIRPAKLTFAGDRPVLCTFDNCTPEGERLTAHALLPSSDDQGDHIMWLPVCRNHAPGWWEGADWDGRHLSARVQDFITIADMDV